MHIFYNLFILALGFSQVLTGKIYGGKEAEPHSRPYMALVEMMMPTKEKQYCSGFLLSEEFVMTAAHCQASSYKVYLGLHDFFEKDHAQIISVEMSFPDKDYNVTSLRNDIMLLKLSSKASFNCLVKPIALAGPEDLFPKFCSVSGWGRYLSDLKKMSTVLREANVTLNRNKQCEDDYFYCSQGQSGPGEGDSGSPLVCENGKVYGLVSHGTNPNENGARMIWYAKTSLKLLKHGE